MNPELRKLVLDKRATVLALYDAEEYAEATRLAEKVVRLSERLDQRYKVFAERLLKLCVKAQGMAKA